MSEHILFIIPPYFNLQDYLTKNSKVSLPPFTIPYGILSIDAYIKGKCKKQIVVDILDLNLPMREALQSGDESWDMAGCFNALMEERVKNFDPSIICISALFNCSFTYIEVIASSVKKYKPTLLVVAGGGMPSAAYGQVLEASPSLDAVCKGEGEIPMAELIDVDMKNDVLDSHPSWITQKGILGGKTPQHMFVKNLDEIPVFDYSLINLNDYNSRSLDKRYAGDGSREMCIHTSRGCPCHCVFCANPSLHGNRVRVMSVEKVISEITYMKEQYGLSVLLIEDDNFLFDKLRAKAILRALSPFKLRIEFPNGVAVTGIDEEIAELFAQSGVSTVALAVESGSDYVLNNIMHKRLQSKTVKPTVEMLRNNSVLCHAFIVIGMPGEMPNHRQETLDLLLDVGFDWVHIFCAIPIFGSKLYDLCIKNGYIRNGSFLDYVNSKSLITAPGVDPQEISKIAYDWNLLVNFVSNYNMRSGNYEIAIKYFHNVVSKYSEHAIAHYYLAQAYKAIDRFEKSEQYKNSFLQISSRSDYWRDRAAHYGLL